MTWRALIYQMRNPGVYWYTLFSSYLRSTHVRRVRLAMYIMLSLMIGTIYLRVWSVALFPALTCCRSATTPAASRTAFRCCSTCAPSWSSCPSLSCPAVSSHSLFYVFGSCPAVLLDRNVFVRERSNGLYGPLSYVIANTVVAVPVSDQATPACLQLTLMRRAYWLLL